MVKQNIGIVGVPNLSALLFGTFFPVSPIAAVFLNNGSCLVAAGNAIRALGFKAKPLPSASDSVQDVSSSRNDDSASIKVQSEGATAHSLDLAELSKRVGLSYQKISARRKRRDFGSWIASHDPEGQVWNYCSKSNSYTPVAA